MLSDVKKMFVVLPDEHSRDLLGAEGLQGEGPSFPYCPVGPLTDVLFFGEKMLSWFPTLVLS